MQKQFSESKNVTPAATLGGLLGNFADARMEGGVSYQIIAKNVLRAVMQNWDPVYWPSGILDLRTLRLLWTHHQSLYLFYTALQNRHDPHLLHALRVEVETLLAQEELQQDIAVNDVQQRQFAIANLLSLYVMFEAKTGHTITVPRYSEEKKRFLSVRYSITPIELTPQKGLWAGFFKNKRMRVYSYGLMPVTLASTHNSLLIHSGTGWETALGAGTQSLTNLSPSITVGEKLYLWGKSRLHAWVDEQPNKVETMGHSLGGALALLTGMARSDKVARVDTLNAPGLHSKNYGQHSDFGLKFGNKPSVYLQRNAGDPVRYLGRYEENWQAFKVTSSTSGPGFPFGGMVNHLRNLPANQGPVDIKEIDVAKYNGSSKRRCFNAFVECVKAVLLFKAMFMHYLPHILLYTAIVATLVFCPFISVPLLAWPLISAITWSAPLQIFCLSTLVYTSLSSFYNLMDDLIFHRENLLYHTVNFMFLGLLSFPKALYDFYQFIRYEREDAATEDCKLTDNTEFKTHAPLWSCVKTGLARGVTLLIGLAWLIKQLLCLPLLLCHCCGKKAPSSDNAYARLNDTAEDAGHPAEERSSLQLPVTAPLKRP